MSIVLDRYNILKEIGRLENCGYLIQKKLKNVDLKLEKDCEGSKNPIQPLMLLVDSMNVIVCSELFCLLCMSRDLPKKLVCKYVLMEE